MRARGIRGDFSFGEQILDIADNTTDDWSYNPQTGKLSVNKELVLRSKIRIEARQLHMSRLLAAVGRAPADTAEGRLESADPRATSPKGRRADCDEPPRVSRRLQLLRGWSHDEASSPIFR
jgi:hypothetical protein